jgi:hypothetical protein
MIYSVSTEEGKFLAIETRKAGARGPAPIVVFPSVTARKRSAIVKHVRAFARQSAAKQG